MNRSTDTARESDVLAALRQATASRHERLDSGLPLSRPDATLADYARHLQLLRAWLAPLAAWQQDYSDGPQGPAGIAAAPHLALIEADLAEPSLAAFLRAPQLDSAPWPDDASAAYRWGVAYVVEGSQLGGAVLHKRLADQLAPHPLRYLRGAGEGGPGPRWRTFMLALRDQVQGEAQVADACAGACDAFDRILGLAFSEC
ncbi:MULTISPECIES: biliverdin-producing heme oxygenase [unclassified Massilia]|uniref:biliverdin-producing heme oxygenase n=1 Tax=unclassified Massilia TaxID=2609279 RepID=UPI0017850B96|nr:MULTISPECIES: biliverdin-producing heme oxygenase [unclassified Massilia]MBD8528852.1 biliverdin-producing heme oxygenase [Massilia sp. CFBP 13647]MBD8673494.1 biliverdin-producing heme oxygenase [Massilia sp. CFBP 13721]